MLEGGPAPATVYVERRPLVRIKIIYVSVIPEFLIAIHPSDLENERVKGCQNRATYGLCGGPIYPAPVCATSGKPSTRFPLGDS